jgi:hypothetical protein
VTMAIPVLNASMSADMISAGFPHPESRLTSPPMRNIPAPSRPDAAPARSPLRSIAKLVPVGVMNPKGTTAQTSSAINSGIDVQPTTTLTTMNARRAATPATCTNAAVRSTRVVVAPHQPGVQNAGQNESSSDGGERKRELQLVVIVPVFSAQRYLWFSKCCRPQVWKRSWRTPHDGIMYRPLRSV